MGRSRKYNGDEIWSRNCPTCNTILTYSQKSQLTEAIKKNRKCQKCGCGWSRGQNKFNNSSIKFNVERAANTRKHKFINGESVPWNKGLSASSNEILKKMSENHKGFKHTDEVKKIIGIHSKKRWESGLYDSQKNPNQDPFKKYQNKVHRLTKKIKHLIDGYDESKRGRMGKPGAYQIDHIVDIKWGFENGIPAEFIADLSNLQFIPWEENIKKGYYGKSKN